MNSKPSKVKNFPALQHHAGSIFKHSTHVNVQPILEDRIYDHTHDLYGDQETSLYSGELSGHTSGILIDSPLKRLNSTAEEDFFNYEESTHSRSFEQNELSFID
jgi:hypothetical protein